jgi:very-short-patch-repair endonuclease
MVESLLWSRLRARQLQGIKFRRQQPIENYIVDFVSFEKRIVIELDGGQHKMNKEKDNERDRFLAENGFTVLRFWDSEVIENMEGVLEVIRKKCLQ